ncbi:MAG: sulfotransferase [Cyanobacteria bacterium J06638_22]
MPGPDFLGIGMPKAGTDWLYDQLDVHPQFWMPPLKELHFFDYVQPASLYERGHSSHKVWKRLNNASERREEFARRMQDTRGRTYSHRDDAFLDRVSALLCNGFSIEDYKTLFEVKEPLISGDITPAYCTLDEKNIEYVAKNLAPNLKLVLLIRNPVERLWSQLCMQIRRRPECESMLENFDEFRAYVERPGVQARSYASLSFERWARTVPEQRIWAGLLDDLRDNATGFRASVIRFLGADPEAYQGDRPPGFNRKVEEKKFPISCEHRTYLREYFDDEIRRCAQLFGGHANRW